MPETTPQHRLTPNALLELKIPRHPALSPDGKKVVFEVSEADFEESRSVSRLWLAETASDTTTKPRQITFSYEGERSPGWSPDGRYIAFLSTRPDMTEMPPDEEEDDPKDQIWLLPTQGGEAQRLTNTKEGVRKFEWMPDSTAIVYLTEEARPQPLQHVHDDSQKRKLDPTIENEEKQRRQFWEIGIEDKKPELLYTGDYGIGDFVLSANGNRLAYISNETGEPNDYHRYDLFVLDLEVDGEEDAEPSDPRRIVERSGAKFSPQWSPDGTQIAFLAGLDPELSYSQEGVWLVSAAGGVPHCLSDQTTYDAHDLHWDRAENRLYAKVSDRTNAPLVRFVEITEDSAILQPVTSPGEVVSCLEYDLARNADTVVAVLEDDRTPPELYVIETDGTRRALTELNKEFTGRYRLPKQEVIRWQTDIGEIEGLLTWPINFREEGRAKSDELPARDEEKGITEEETLPSSFFPLPLIVQVHGGPKGHAVNTIRNYYQPAVWASEGYLVLQPNFRGSEGYGHDFAVANRRDLGGGDFRDIMAGVDMLIEQGLADPERLGIMGGSYGGYMANMAIGKTDRFAAAISMFGMFSLITSTANSEISRFENDYLGHYYWEDPDIYRQCSPSTYLENIRTPTLILHGDSDNNTYLANSKEMYHALRARGVTCRFVHYPREGHGVREPNHKLDEMRRCLDWFDRYLKSEDKVRSTYRLEEKIEQGGYELHVLRAEDGEYAGRHPEDTRLLEVTLSLASQEAVEVGWELALETIRLLGPGGAVCPLAGVPVSAGGSKLLVEGENLHLRLQPDEKTGRLSLGLGLAYEIPAEGGHFTLLIADFPPVVFPVAPKEKEDEEEKSE